MKRKTNCRLRISLFILTVLITLAVFTACAGKPPAFWLADGTTVQNLSWNVQLSDSSSVLRKENEVWLLPVAADTASVETTRTRHLSSKELSLPSFFRNSDQVVMRESATITAEYYAFRQDGVYALGYAGTDSSSLYTLYEPPLLFLPNDLAKFDAGATCEATPKTWDARADSFRVQPKMRVQLSITSRGSVNYGAQVRPAVLVKMSISQDAIIAHGETGLIVPDAVMMQSQILLVQDVGPLLEWGIRAKTNERPQDVTDIRPEQVIQIILYQPL